ARALEARGHEAAFVCSAPFSREVERFGLRALPAGLPWEWAEAERYFPVLRGVPQHERYAWILENVYAGEAARRLYPELLAICEAFRPDVVVRDQMEFASWLAAERLGIPHVSYGYGLGFQESDQAVVRPLLAGLAAELGVRAGGDLEAV